MEKIFVVCVDPGRYKITKGNIYLVYDYPDEINDPDKVLYELKDDSNHLIQCYKYRFIPISKLLEE